LAVKRMLVFDSRKCKLYLNWV